jgi:hypothetical protein
MKTEEIKKTVENSLFGVGRDYALKMLTKIEKLEAEMKLLKKG